MNNNQLISEFLVLEQFASQLMQRAYRARKQLEQAQQPAPTRKGLSNEQLANIKSSLRKKLIK